MTGRGETRHTAKTWRKSGETEADEAAHQKKNEEDGGGSRGEGGREGAVKNEKERNMPSPNF